MKYQDISTGTLLTYTAIKDQHILAEAVGDRYGGWLLSELACEGSCDKLFLTPHCIEDFPSWGFKIVEPKDMVLYSYLPHKTKRFFELIGRHDLSR